MVKVGLGCSSKRRVNNSLRSWTWVVLSISAATEHYDPWLQARTSFLNDTGKLAPYAMPRWQ